MSQILAAIIKKENKWMNIYVYPGIIYTSGN